MNIKLCCGSHWLSNILSQESFWKSLFPSLDVCLTSEGGKKTRCFPNEAGIADFQSHPPLISDVSSQNGRREAGRLCLQLISINHRPSGSHLPVSCRGKLSAAGEVLPSLMLPNSECPLCPHQAQPHLSHFCSTFYLSGEHSVLIRPQMAQFLGDHFGKSLGVNFATSMAVKSDWKISQKNIQGGWRSWIEHMLNKNYYIFIFNNLKISTIWPRLSTCPLFHGNILVTICAQVWFPIYVRGSLQWIMCPRDSWGLIALLASTADPRLSKHFLRKPHRDSSPLTCSMIKSFATTTKILQT